MKNSLCLGVLAVTCLGLGAANAQPPAHAPPGRHHGPPGPHAGPVPVVLQQHPPRQRPPARPTGPGPGAPGRGSTITSPTPGRPALTGVGRRRPHRLGGLLPLRRQRQPRRHRHLRPDLRAGLQVQGGVRSVFFRPDRRRRLDRRRRPVLGVVSRTAASETATLHNFASTTTRPSSAQTTHDHRPELPGHADET